MKCLSPCSRDGTGKKEQPSVFPGVCFGKERLCFCCCCFLTWQFSVPLHSQNWGQHLYFSSGSSVSLGSWREPRKAGRQNLLGQCIPSGSREPWLCFWQEHSGVPRVPGTDFLCLLMEARSTCPGASTQAKKKKMLTFCSASAI